MIQSKFIEISSRRASGSILIDLSWMESCQLEHAIIKMVKTDLTTFDTASLDNHSSIIKYSKTVHKLHIVLLTILIEVMKLDK